MLMEIALFLELMEQERNIMLGKRIYEIIKKKNEAWKRISSLYNGADWGPLRSAHLLKRMLEHQKKISK